jgi:medium-chain acyl-[acyl-carrier-protein] hydrolase
MIELGRKAWLRFHRDDARACVRLFCFPFAGGGASLYRNWASVLPPNIAVCPLQLPGREERMREPPFTQVEPLCQAVLTAIDPLLDRPVALFGHSMGAIIAYELARALQRHGRSPLHLFVSGQRAPHLPLGRPVSYNLPLEAFRHRLRELNGTPEAVLQNPEMMDLLLPLLRADFELSETYRREAHAPLTCPVTAFGGIEDVEISRPDIQAWRAATVGDFRVRLFPGDHFFLQAAARDVMREIADQLASAT